jgi:hypothetical protein
MTDGQLLTLVVAIVLPLSMLIYSNSRVTEAKETLRAEMNTLRVEVLAKLEQMNARHDLVMSKLVDIDNRLSKVEDKLGV